MVVAQQFVEEIKCLGCAHMLSLLCNEFDPRAARIGAQNSVVVVAQLQAVLVQILHQPVRAQHLRDLHKLVVVVGPAEERLLAENLVPRIRKRRETRPSQA